MIGKDQHVRHYGLEVYNLDAQIIFLAEIFELVETIMAWNNYHLSSGGSNLVRLDFSGDHSSFPEWRSHGNITAPAAAAMIVRTVWVHFAKIGTESIHEISCFLPKATIPGDVARILIGYRFGNSFGRIYLDSPVSHIFIEKLDTVHYGNRRLAAR